MIAENVDKVKRKKGTVTEICFYSFRAASLSTMSFFLYLS